MANDIISPENLVYKKPELMNDTPMHYCPGCSHGVVHKLVAEVIEEMAMQEIGYCREAPMARPLGIHIPGRWRLGLYRYMRDYSCAEPW